MLCGKLYGIMLRLICLYDYFSRLFGPSGPSCRLCQQLDRRESGDVIFLFEMGKTQVQVICSFREDMPDRQYLTLYAERLPAVRRRLESNGIRPGDYRRDPCTGRRMLRFDGPDNVRIEIMEAD